MLPRVARRANNAAYACIFSAPCRILRGKCGEGGDIANAVQVLEQEPGFSNPFDAVIPLSEDELSRLTAPGGRLADIGRLEQSIDDLMSYLPRTTDRTDGRSAEDIIRTTIEDVYRQELTAARHLDVLPYAREMVEDRFVSHILTLATVRGEPHWIDYAHGILDERHSIVEVPEFADPRDRQAWSELRQHALLVRVIADWFELDNKGEDEVFGEYFDRAIDTLSPGIGALTWSLAHRATRSEYGASKARQILRTALDDDSVSDTERPYLLDAAESLYMEGHFQGNVRREDVLLVIAFETPLSTQENGRPKSREAIAEILTNVRPEQTELHDAVRSFIDTADLPVDLVYTAINDHNYSVARRLYRVTGEDQDLVRALCAETDLPVPLIDAALLERHVIERAERLEVPVSIVGGYTKLLTQAAPDFERIGLERMESPELNREEAAFRRATAVYKNLQNTTVHTPGEETARDKALAELNEAILARWVRPMVQIVSERVGRLLGEPTDEGA